MKGIYDMTAPGSGSIYGQLDGIASNAQGLQELADNQASIMQSLANTLDVLAPNLQGAAGTAMQQCGQEMHAEGMRFSTAFADHSQRMSNNATLLGSHDQEHAQHILSQVGNLT